MIAVPSLNILVNTRKAPYLELVGASAAYIYTVKMASKPMRILVGCKRVIDYAVKVCIAVVVCMLIV